MRVTTLISYERLRSPAAQRQRRRGSHFRCRCGRLWYDGLEAVANAIGYAMQYGRSRDAVIRIYDETGNVVETQEHKGDFKDW